MSVILRDGDVDSDAAPLLSLLQDQLSPSIDRQRFDWLYRKCPHGEAKVWVAVDMDSGRLVGAAALFPRKINLEGKLGTGFVLGDFCVSADHRSLGLAIRLQRACLEGLQKGTFLAGYDLPSRTMLAVYRRLSLQPNSEMIRMVRILRADSQIASHVRHKTVARVISRAANALLSIAANSRQPKSSLDVEVLEGRCGQEFTDLANEVRGRLGNCVFRSAEFLNWRYFDHPQRKYEFLVARRRGHLEGYLTLCQEAATASVVDWFGYEPAELRKELMRGAIAFLKPRGCESIQAGILASHAYCRDLKALGFRPRETSPVIFIGRTEHGPTSAGMNDKWLLMNGDRES